MNCVETQCCLDVRLLQQLKPTLTWPLMQNLQSIQVNTLNGHTSCVSAHHKQLADFVRPDMSLKVGIVVVITVAGKLAAHMTSVIITGSTQRPSDLCNCFGS